MALDGLKGRNVDDPEKNSGDDNITNDGSFSFDIPETDNEVKISCFSQDVHDVTLHFQIIKLPKQIYAWIGCNSAKLGHLYAAAATKPNHVVSATPILGGTADNTGLSIARRLVLKTGLNIILACNIPKNSSLLEANAERILSMKLASLGYTRPKSQGTALHIQ